MMKAAARRVAPGRRKSKPRQRLEDYCILYADYFTNDPLHSEVVFRRRFRMSRKLSSTLSTPFGVSTATSYARRIALPFLSCIKKFKMQIPIANC
jgi:hypothetical protein